MAVKMSHGRGEVNKALLARIEERILMRAAKERVLMSTQAADTVHVEEQ